MCIDSRANGPERLTAPAPLPHVSRKALKRVLNPVPAPTVCRYCSKGVELVNNAVIYHGRSYGDWPYAYLCQGCRAYVALHPRTDVPLGTLANGELRAARTKSKRAFHSYMQAEGLSRSLAYEWLAGRLGIPVGECHFGWFDLADCARAEQVIAKAKQPTSMQRAFAAVTNPGGDRG